MTPRIRKIIMIIFFIAFAISGPLMLFYTTGYSFNLQKKKLEAVGVLMLDAEPRDSQLYINGEIQSGGAPWRFNNLRPNYYSVKAAKDGYYPWQKNLEIKPKTSTLAYNVVLFKKNLPTIFVKHEKPIQIFAFSPDKKKLVFADDAGQIFLHQEVKNIFLANTTLPNQNNLHLDWSDNDELVLVTEKNQTQINYFIISPGEPNETIDLTKITPKKFSKLIWRPGSDYLLYGLSAKNLYKINLLTKTVKKIAENTEDFVFSYDNLYLLIKRPTAVQLETLLAKHNPLLLNNPVTKINELENHDYAFGASFKNFLLLKDLSKGDVLLKDLVKKKEPLLNLAGSQGAWNRTNYTTYLFYYNNSEVSALDLGNQQISLIGRYSSNLAKVEPVYGAAYVILQIDNNLYLAELDDRDRRNVEVLFSGKNIRHIYVDKKGENLYFIDEIGAERGIFKFELR